MSLAPWQLELQSAVRSLEELRSWGFAVDASEEIAQKYRVLIPEYYLRLADPNNPMDPIRLMAIPRADESRSLLFRDPIGDLAFQVAPRLTHRYADRALLHTTNYCPMYCRFCFRKNLMNEREEDLYQGDFKEAFAYLKSHPEIKELILTGGDPWIWNDDKLAQFCDQVERELPHLERLRFHTRMPVTLPSRVTSELISALQNRKIQIVVVTHFNHPVEITVESSQAVRLLRAAGFLVLNQSVLLRDVNNKLEILEQLFLGLGRIGVLPYYLHHCDLVAGAEHFRTSLEEGRALWASLRGRIPGYLLPEYVMEIPGGGGKLPVGARFVEQLKEGEYSLHFNGTSTPYFENRLPE